MGEGGASARLPHAVEDGSISPKADGARCRKAADLHVPM